MGFWVSFVLVRGQRSVLEWPALAEYEDSLGHEEQHGPWLLARFEGGDLEGHGEALIPDLAQESGAPALMGFVLDSDAVELDACSASGGYWRACLVRNVMRGYCEDDDSDFGVYLLPSAAVAAAASWAKDAGLTSQLPALETVFAVEEAEMFEAENVFFDLLRALGLVHGQFKVG
jgi:hypothetical protein